MFYITLGIGLAVEGDALDVAVFCTVVFCTDSEVLVLARTSGLAYVDGDLVEKRRSEPILT